MTVDAWADLVGLAVIGTERRDVATPVMAGSLGEVLGALDWSEPERAVLGAAALLSVATAAGATPRRLDAPEPAPPATGKTCTPGAQAVLDRLLGGEKSLLSEALERFAATGMTLPDVLLAQLLDTATADRSLRRPLVRVGGDRLAWLAAHDERWQWASGGADHAEIWQTGTRDQRTAALADLRASDPAAARTLLESTWDADSPEDRCAFVELLADGLSLDDEPLLERALDDRRKPVRQAAARLLAGLPGSGLRERMTQRLAPLIAVSGGRRPELEIDAPAEIDKAGRRDGIEDANAPPGYGPRAWWLCQIIRAAPLGVWKQRSGLAPVRILELVRGSEYSTPVYQGLSDASQRERDPEWAVAWMTIHPSNAAQLEGLPADVANPLLIGAVGKEKDADKALWIIARAPGPWNAELSRAFLQRLRRIGGPINGFYYRAALDPVIERLHPDTIPEALGAAEAVWPPPEFDTRTRLTIRHAISQEIR